MRLLIFNCHEAWVSQLDRLDATLDVVVGLSGRHTVGWDTSVRPVPRRARLLTLEALRREPAGYDCAIAHGLADLREIEWLRVPKLLVLHATLDGRIAEEGAALTADTMRWATAVYLRRIGAHAVAVSPLKGRSWGQQDDDLLPGIDVDELPAATAELACGLRVANHIARRPRILRWDLHRTAFSGLPVTLVGLNPGMPGVEPARDWPHLQRLMQVHRFLVHTVDPALEDGYNLAVLEAMATGLPVLGNPHPSSPIEHGVSGFLSDDPEELAAFARRLLADRELALELGRAARETVRYRFSPRRFRSRLLAAIGRAREAHRAWREALTRGTSDLTEGARP